MQLERVFHHFHVKSEGGFGLGDIIPGFCILMAVAYGSSGADGGTG
jgi:hypothetical protein